jgi:mono/diheme cytochrome c family protein
MRRLLLLAALASALAGCGGGTVTSATPETVVGTLPKAPSGSAAGKALFLQNGCGGCHTYTPAGSNGKVGPDLDRLAADAAKAGRGPVKAYVRESILNPNAYVVPGFPSNVMPSFQGKLTSSQVGQLVDFLTTKS